MRKARISDKCISYTILNGCAIVRPEGACDERCAEALAKLVNSSMVRSKDLILDLSRCAYVETPGYRWLVRQLRQLESSGRSLVVAGMTPPVLRVFRLLHFDRMIPTAEGVSGALEKLDASKQRAAG